MCRPLARPLRVRDEGDQELPLPARCGSSPAADATLGECAPSVPVSSSSSSSSSSRRCWWWCCCCPGAVAPRRRARRGAGTTKSWWRRPALTAQRRACACPEGPNRPGTPWPKRPGTPSRDTNTEYGVLRHSITATAVRACRSARCGRPARSPWSVAWPWSRATGARALPVSAAPRACSVRLAVSRFTVRPAAARPPASEPRGMAGGLEMPRVEEPLHVQHVEVVEQRLAEYGNVRDEASESP